MAMQGNKHAQNTICACGYVPMATLRKRADDKERQQYPERFAKTGEKYR